MNRPIIRCMKGYFKYRIKAKIMKEKINMYGRSKYSPKTNFKDKLLKSVCKIDDKVLIFLTWEVLTN